MKTIRRLADRVGSRLISGMQRPPSYRATIADLQSLYGAAVICDAHPTT
jgi:hypothetical protein